MEVCSVCQVEKHGKVFKTAQDRRTGNTSSSDLVKTRICRHAQNQGCINTDGQINKTIDYKNFGITPERWLDTAKELIKKHEGAIANLTKAYSKT